MPTGRRPDPPYVKIAAAIRAQIESGALRPGDRVPSIRQIAHRWGVAVATATRAMASLREQGLVEPRVGAGTVVSPTASGPPEVPRGPAIPRAQGIEDDDETRRIRLLDNAIAIADAEGVEAVSMRRLAAHLGVGPMSLYRSVASKEDLLRQVADHVFAEIALPADGPPGWRAKLELVARAEWELYRRHPWLHRTVSFTRPLLAPNMMAHTEWTMRAISGLGLAPQIQIREALTVHSIVLAAAASLAQEDAAQADTGISYDRWHADARQEIDPVRFPLLSQIPARIPLDLEGLFEYGLARHLDGFAALVAHSSHESQTIDRPRPTRPSR